MQLLESPTVELVKFLNKLKIKNKDTILQMGHNNIRTSMYRTDIMKETLTDEHFKKIAKIFSAQWTEPLETWEHFTQLLNHLVENRVVLKLDRAPQKLSGPLLKWPKQMLIADVIL